MSLPEDEAKKQENVEETSEVAEIEESPQQSEDDSVVDETAQEESLTTDEALEKALENVNKFKDLAMRAEAEMQNMQRRTARDVENAHKFGLERFLQNLLPVLDSLEKAIEASAQANVDNDAQDPITEGLRLCHKLFLDVLTKESMEVIDPVGEPFDPNEHQAMSMVENPDMEPNSVFAVVQKGYKLNGRLVRAAMVMVTKAAEDA
jgi:molecular chaperone GrpE